MARKVATRKKVIKRKGSSKEPSGEIRKLGSSNGKAPSLKNPVSDYGYRGIFRPSEYNLVEISLIEDGESYVRQAFQKKNSLMFKEGEVFSGKNEETIKYLKNRIRQIEYVTGIPWRSLLRQTGKELISKSNFFWVKVRKENVSGGNIGVQRSKPIAGYFPMGAENVFVKKDENGKILEYEQRLPGSKTKKFRPEDIIHFKCDVKPGYTFGTPKIIPVIMDIQTLRKLEENVEILFYQTLFPIFQYTVGTEVKPAGTITLADGSVVDEVEYVKYQIQNMPSEGGIVTPERHKINYIGANGQIPNYQPVLSYFKNRVLAGLGISALDIGDGDSSNRATADSLSKALIDSVKEYQAVLEDIINSEVVMELLLEGDFSFDPLIEENFVEMRFVEIDIEEQMKKNVNAQLLYNADIIDIDEARKVTGRQHLEKSQEKKMFTERQTIKLMELEHELAIETSELSLENSLIMAEHGSTLSPETEKTSTTTGGGKKTVTKTLTKPSKKAEAAKNSGKSQSAPTNQHGTKTGPQKSRLDMLIKREQVVIDFFEKRYGRDSSQYKTNIKACKQRISKRLKLVETEQEYKNSVNSMNEYFDAI